MKPALLSGPFVISGGHWRVSGEDFGISQLSADVVFEEGRFIVRQLTVADPKGITTESLRRVAVTRMLRTLASQALLMRLASPGKLVPLAARPVPGDPNFQHYVVAMYRLAMALAVPPTAYVADELDVSRTTASRLIADCRRIGLLGQALERQSGEVAAM